MPDDAGGGGNFLTRKIAGIPGFIWLGGAALLAYWFFFRGSGSSLGGPSTSGGGGAVTTGPTRIDKGAVTVNITQRGVGDKGKQGTGDKHHRRKPHVNPGGHNRGVHHHRGHRGHLPNPGGGSHTRGNGQPAPGGPQQEQDQPEPALPQRDVTMATQAAPYEDTESVDASNQGAYDTEYADMGS